MIRSEIIYVDHFDKKYLDRNRHDNTDNALYQLAYGDGRSSEHQGFSQKKTFYDMTLDLFKFLKSISAAQTSYKLEFLHGKEHITCKEKKILEEIIALHNDFSMPKKRKHMTSRPKIQ
ncbi:MAG: hypothetical protein ACP5NW_02560 [Candidatus Woesearchaeota archaeon]